ncbi:adenosylhomocysteinase [soil metagenome]
MLDRVADPVNDEARAWASSIVRRFAAATNLLIAGRVFAVSGSGPQAVALEELLLAIGARSVTDGPVDYLFLAGASASVDATLVIETSDFEIAPAREHTAAGRIEWARSFMPVSAALAAELADSGLSTGIRIGISMVLEPKTAVLALLLRDAGAIVTVFAHPDETDDAVADALRESGIPVFANSAADAAEHRALALAFLDERPQLLIDDGSHLIRLAHTDRPELLDQLIGTAEETTSGLTPLRIMADLGLLRVPVVAVNDARSKTSFDNRYGTGQSCLFTILDLLDPLEPDLDVAGRTIVVAGFGPVGEGVAHHTRALGAHVIIAEIDPVRELQARFAGYRTMPLLDAVRQADIVVSATGVRDTISADVLAACAEGAAIAVAGGVEQEVAIDAVVSAGATRQTVSRKVEQVALPGGTNVLLLDDGGCINVTAGEGNPIEIMDLSFAVQLSAIRHLREGEPLSPGVHPLPRALDDRVAALALGEEVAPVATSERSAEWRTTRFGENG